MLWKLRAFSILKAYFILSKRKRPRVHVVPFKTVASTKRFLLLRSPPKITYMLAACVQKLWTVRRMVRSGWIPILHARMQSMARAMRAVEVPSLFSTQSLLCLIEMGILTSHVVEFKSTTAEDMSVPSFHPKTMIPFVHVPKIPSRQWDVSF